MFLKTKNYHCTTKLNHMAKGHETHAKLNHLALIEDNKVTCYDAKPVARFYGNRCLSVQKLLTLSQFQYQGGNSMWKLF